MLLMRVVFLFYEEEILSCAVQAHSLPVAQGKFTTRNCKLSIHLLHSLAKSN
jgi:hypothetical protein